MSFPFLQLHDRNCIHDVCSTNEYFYSLLLLCEVWIVLIIRNRTVLNSRPCTASTFKPKSSSSRIFSGLVVLYRAYRLCLRSDFQFVRLNRLAEEQEQHCCRYVGRTFSVPLLHAVHHQLNSKPTL